MKCAPMLQEIPQKASKFDIDDVEMNDTRVVYLMDLCQKSKNCMESTCQSLEPNQDRWSSLCDALEMKFSEFTACTVKIQMTSPNMTKYNCLEGMDFYDTSLKVQIELLTTKKECVKEIYKGICGKEALESFDKYVRWTLEGLQFLSQFENVGNSTQM